MRTFSHNGRTIASEYYATNSRWTTHRSEYHYECYAPSNHIPFLGYRAYIRSINGTLVWLGKPLTQQEKGWERYAETLKKMGQREEPKPQRAKPHSQLASRPGVRRVRVQSAHDVGQQGLEQRPLGIEAYIKRAMLPNAAAIVPTRAPDFGADFKTPLAQSITAGFLAFLGGIALTAVSGYWFGIPQFVDGIAISALGSIGLTIHQWFTITGKNRAGLYAIEQFMDMDLDGDGQVGSPIKPRSIPILGKTPRDLPMPDETTGNLYHDDWRQVAVAILVHGANVSSRGIADDSTMGRQKASHAVKHLNRGYTVQDGNNNNVNQAGYDWLYTFLPDGMEPTIERPST